MTLKGKSVRTLALATACWAGLLTATPVIAVAPEPPAASPTAIDTQDDQTIVVTAQRRSERSRDVPISITALGAGQLRQANVQQLSDITKLTPALRFDNVGGFAQATIRGVGTALVVSGGGSNVGIYLDGFYSPNPLATDSQLLNVQNIQVLKGPQGTLFGRSTTGGAIVITTAEPKSDPEVIGEASYGRFNTQRYQAYATAGFNENIAFDVQGTYARGDDFVHNIVTGERHANAYENWSVRTGVKLEVGDSASILLRYTHQNTNDPTSTAYGTYRLDGRPLSAAENFSAFFGPPVVTTRRNEVTSPDPTVFKNKSDIFQGTVRDDLGFADLTSYTQYRQERAIETVDADASSTRLFYGIVPVRDRTFTQELLLNSKPGRRLQWTAGAFYLRYDDFYLPSTATIFGQTTSPYYSSRTRTSSIAAYADATYRIGERLFLTAGARYTHDEIKKPYYAQANGSGGLNVIPVDEVKGDKVTPRFVVRFKPDQQSSIYASYTIGYKPAILNVGAGTLNGIYVRPEKISAFEVGYKYEKSAFNLDIAAYYYKYKDLQVASYIGTMEFINNAADARIYGLEGQANYHITPSFSINLAGAYTNAEYQDYANSTLIVFTKTGVYNNVAVSAKGNEMQRAPRFTMTASAVQNIKLAGGNLALSANLYHSAKFYFDSSNQFGEKGFENLGLRVEWTDPSKHYTLAVFGDNITNSRYRTQVQASTLGVGDVWNFPVTYGASARFHF